MKKYVSSAQFKSNADKDCVVVKQVSKYTSPTISGDRSLKFIISTENVDRDNDVIKQDGWDLSYYLDNPVVLWDHNHSLLPVGTCTAVGVENGNLCATVQFVTADLNPFAEQVYQYCLQGHLRATSVGFMPIEWEISNDENRGHGISFTYTKSELYEFSIVTIPSNRQALIQDASDDTIDGEEPIDDQDTPQSNDDGDDMQAEIQPDISIAPADDGKSINRSTLLNQKQKVRILELMYK